jgi:hypothetical protein
MAHAFRIPSGIKHRNGGAPGGAEQNKSVQVCRIDDGLEILHVFVERELYLLTVRQTAAPRIVPR